MRKIKKNNQFTKHCNFGDVLKSKRIINKVCELSGVTRDEIIGLCRKREFTTPRFFAISLIKEFTDLPLKAIGREFSNRDHSTIIHSLKVVSDLCDGDRLFKKDYEFVKSKVLEMMEL